MKAAIKIFGTLFLAFIWLYFMVIVLPVLLTGGTITWMIGIFGALFLLGVPIYMLYRVIQPINSKDLS